MGQSFSGIGAYHGLAAIQRSGTPRFLYAVNPIGDIASYQLPLKTGESPAVTLAVTTAGLTNDSNYLYASTRNGLKVAAYPLPLTPSETPATTLAVLGSGAETVAGHFLYVGLQGSNGTSGGVAAYNTPLHAQEKPAAVTSVAAPLVMATDGTNLYLITSIVNGQNTLAVLPLPLKNNESPSLVLSGLNSPAGLAVRHGLLYLSSYDNAAVNVYKLPLKSGAQPATTLSTGFRWAGSLAVNDAHLYVSDTSGSAWAYALPIQSGEKPTAYVGASRATYGNLLSTVP